MATIEELRSKFDTLTTAQKMQFALGIKAQVLETGNEEHKLFYNECVEKYNTELRASALSEPEADEDLLQLIKQEELPMQDDIPGQDELPGDAVVALEKLEEKSDKTAFLKKGIGKITSLLKKK